MSKRKTGALRATDTRYSNGKEIQTFYMNQSKTIKFEQAKQKPVRKRVDLVPKSINQEKFILALLDEETDIVVVSGPAGTGKTYLAMQAALKALQNKECERIILTRPSISVENENHGFLPGDLNSKLEPWMKPMIDVFREYYSMKEIAEMLSEEIVEFAPLGMMRGRTFKNSWILLDESQNALPMQLKMLLTRIGTNSKIVICGDVEQTDRKTKDNGLMDLIEKLQSESIDCIQICQFDNRDIQRHKIIEKILKLYK